MPAPEDIPNVEWDVYHRTADAKPMYWDTSYYHFQTADRLLGCWYFARLSSEYNSEESFFELSEKGAPFVFAEPKQIETVRKILAYHIQNSPVHQIGVLLRAQDESADVSHPVCTLSQFMNNLSNGSIRWN